MNMENSTQTEIQNRSSRNNVYAICSGTKASGKTWLAATICHHLGLMKKKALFFDADCGIENISGQLGIEKCVSYSRLLNGSLVLNHAITHFNNGKFDIICSFPGEDGFNKAPEGRMQLLAGDLAYFSKFYDYVFIDCANNEFTSVNPLFNICDHLLVLVNADPPSITAAYHKLEKLKKITAEAHIHTIINRAASFDEGVQAYKTLLKAAKEYIKVDLNLLGIIRQDSRIREAVINQMLLLSRYPSCEGAEDVKSIVRQIIKENENGF